MNVANPAEQLPPESTPLADVVPKVIGVLCQSELSQILDELESGIDSVNLTIPLPLVGLE